jgi:hypothetical protein
MNGLHYKVVEGTDGSLEWEILPREEKVVCMKIFCWVFGSKPHYEVKFGSRTFRHKYGKDYKISML